MKLRLFSFICLVFATGFFLPSCEETAKFDESIPVNPVLTPIKSVTVMDGKELRYAEISDQDRTIHLELKSIMDLSQVEVHFEFSKRAKLITPMDTVMILNLREPFEIVINNLYKDLTYTMTASVLETFEIDKSLFREFRLANDSPRMEGDILYLWNNEAMAKPNDYGSIGYRNYLTNHTFTVDLGDYYNLYKFTANLYWAYTNVCPKVYELWGYTKEGVPPSDGNWDNWTKLATIDNSKSTLADFAAGDTVEFAKEESPRVRYVRVHCLENYRNPPTTAFSLCEITFWAWNMYI